MLIPLWFICGPLDRHLDYREPSVILSVDVTRYMARGFGIHRYNGDSSKNAAQVTYAFPSCDRLIRVDNVLDNPSYELLYYMAYRIAKYITLPF